MSYNQRRGEAAASALLDALDRDDPKVVTTMPARLAAGHPHLPRRLVQALADERPRVRSAVRSVLFQAGQSDSAALARRLRRALDGRYGQIDSGIIWGLLRWSESLRDGPTPGRDLAPGDDGPAIVDDATAGTFDTRI